VPPSVSGDERLEPVRDEALALDDGGHVASDLRLGGDLEDAEAGAVHRGFEHDVGLGDAT
jgi:hypothetical protein